MLYEELDDRFGRRKKRTVIFGMAGGTPPTPPTPPTPSVLEEKALNFYDFEGTLVASYDADEIAGLTELPEAPDHSADEVPLTFEEWNWTLAEIKEYHTDMPEATIDVGATYHPTDGKLHLIVETFVDNYLNPIQLQFNQGAQIDWGDGTISSASTSDIKHFYEKKGRYHVIATTTSTNFSVYKNANIVPDELYLNSTIAFLTTQGNARLKRLVLPSSVASVANNALESCYSLKAIVIPRSISALVNSFLSGCYSLGTVCLPCELALAGSYIFNNCHSLRKLTIPRSRQHNGSYILASSMIEDAILPRELESVGSAFLSSCYVLKKVVLPPEMTTISSYMMNQDYNLEVIELPEGIQSIEAYAFSDVNSLATLIIPSTVTSIGNKALYSYRSLPSVTILATTPPTLGTNAFYSSSIQKIYVPAESVEAYKSATNWANYAEKIEAIPE